MNKNNKNIFIVFICILTVALVAVFFLTRTEATLPPAVIVATPPPAPLPPPPPPPDPVLIGKATTSFKGSSAGRKHNIVLSSGELNGSIILPGQEFSFNDTLGEETEEDGYVVAGVLVDGKKVDGIGGGTCQVSTTIFRAALNAGLPITKRIGHSRVVGYYGPGLDATVASPYVDLVFMNDTGYEIEVRSKIVEDTVTFELYGVSDGRTSTLSKVDISKRVPAPEPKYEPSPLYIEGKTICTEEPEGGMTTRVTYTVTLADSTIREKIFKTIYYPVEGTCFIGTKPAPPPAPPTPSTPPPYKGTLDSLPPPTPPMSPTPTATSAQTPAPAN